VKTVYRDKPCLQHKRLSQGAPSHFIHDLAVMNT